MADRHLCFDVWAVRELTNDHFGKEHWDFTDSIDLIKAAVAFLLQVKI